MKYICIYIIYQSIIRSTLQVQFYGDIPLSEHLRQFCSTKFTSKPNLVITESRSHLHHFLLNINCLHIVHPNISETSGLQEKLNEKQDNTFQIIFNYNSKMLNAEQFKVILMSLSILYRNCDHCAPFIILFNSTLHLLSQWTRASFNSLDTSFHSVLVSLSDNTVVHIRPIIFGCVRYADIFIPQNVNDFKKLQIPYQQCNLQGTKLNVSVNHNLPFCDIVTGPDGELITKFSLEIAILESMQSRFNFSSTLIDAKQDWGILVNKSWTGVIGHILNGTSNLGICVISRTIARQKYVDFTLPIYLNSITFIVSSPGFIQHRWIVASPFSTFTWILIVLSLDGITLFLFLTSGKTHFNAFITIHRDLYAVLLNQTVKWSKRNAPNYTRWIFAFWILGALILSNAYSSAFYSILIVSEYGQPIDSIQDLIKIAKSDSKYIVMNGRSIYWYDIVNAKEDNYVYFELGKHLNRKMPSKMEEIPLIDQNVNKFIVIDNRMFLATDRYIKAQSALHIASENISPDYIAQVLPKKSPLLAPFNMLIRRMHNMGLIDKWIAKTYSQISPGNKAIYPIGGTNTLYENPIDQKSSLMKCKEKMLSLGDLRSVFFVWFILVIASILVFAAEMLNLWFEF